MVAISVSKDSLPVETSGGDETRTAELGDYTVMFESIPAGFPPGGPKAFEGLPDDACQCPHWGYLFKGRFRIRLTDGTEEVITAGSAYYLPAGHQFEAIEDSESVEFSPTELLAQMMAVVGTNVARLMNAGQP